MARQIGETRPTVGNGLLEGEKVSSGPFATYKIAMRAGMLGEHAGNYRRHLFRTCLENGIFSTDPNRYGRIKVTLPMVAEWTGYSINVLKSWLAPASSPKRRAMPLPAIRLIIHEFRLRDASQYDWPKMLRKCR